MHLPVGTLRGREAWRSRIRPWLFVAPALLLLGVYLLYPLR